MNGITVLPRLVIEVDGVPLGAQDAKALAEVRVQQALSLPTLCELVFVEPRGSLAAARTLLPGASLRVQVEDRSPALFTGQVTAVEYGYGPSSRQEVRVRGYDLLHQLRKRQPVRSHVDLTVEDLARELVGDLGLSVDATESGPLSRRLVQWRQSDLEMLNEAARTCGLYFFVEETVLRIITLAGAGEPSGLTLGGSLLEARVDVNTDPACRAVQVLGWDPWRIEGHQGSATEARTGRHVPIDPAPSRVGAPGERTVVDQALQSDEQADALAQSELDRRVAGEITLWGVARGDPCLQPGRRIVVEGVAALLAGRYVLTSVHHRVDRERGFVSELSTVPPPEPVRTHAGTSTLGIVTDVDDPERLGRVRVSLANYGGLETDWLAVLIPGAGKDKGLIALPDVEDQVMVFLTGGDPAQGIVLGGLYGTHGPPDAGVEGGAVRRYTLVTPGGQRVLLDDEKRTVRIENDNDNYLQVSPGRARLANSRGSYVELTGDRVRVHANADLEIEAPGKSVTIRGASIDFESA